ncbi:MAG: type II CAAX prenyl endopeptidase Rce1 family protein, partial [Halobacteriaceae archaeon]
AIIVGIVWTIWHLPVQLFLPSLSALSTTDQILMRVATVPLAILFAWLYNATDGSVIIPMLFHAGWNSSGILLPAPITGLSSETLLLVKSARYGTMLIIVGFLLMIYDHDSLAPGGKHTQRLVSAHDEASATRSA